MPLKSNISHSDYRKCPICESKSAVLVYPETENIKLSPSTIQVTDKFFGLHGDIVKCEVCGFVYIGREKYIQNVVKMYREMRDETYLNEEKERRNSFRRIIKEIEAIRKGKRGKILDIGCFTGGLLAEAKAYGWDVHGVDPSIWACKTAEKFHGIKIANSKIEDYKPDMKFDAITIIDVLEHVENPKKIINKIKALIKPDGIICIVTPDYGSAAAKILGKKWWGIRLAHLSYFTYSDFLRLIKCENLDIIKKRSYVRFFSFYYIFVRLFPSIERMSHLKELLKRISVPLLFFDTFELYLRKKK